MIDRNFEVYRAVDKDGNLLYIGSGRRTRHKHCNSGISHSYELNKMHFNGEFIGVEIIKDNLTKSESVEFEKTLILGLKPAFNKDYLCKDKFNMVREHARVPGDIVNYIRNDIDETNKSIRIKWSRLLKEFFNKYPLGTLLSGIYLGREECRKWCSSSHKNGKYKYFNNIFEAKNGILRIKKSFIDFIIEQNK